MDNSQPLQLKEPGDVARGVAERARERRLARNLTQAGLAARSGVSLGALKLFERTGKISFEALVRIAFALDAEGGFDGLFAPAPPRSIEDVIEKPKRRRGRRT